MAREDERIRRAQEEPIVGSLPDVPGIGVAMRLTPGLGVHLRGLADELLVHDFPGATLQRYEREMLATAVSAANDCFFCMDSHGAFANALLEKSGAVEHAPLIDVVKLGLSDGFDPKMAALLHVARTVRRDPLELTADDVAAATDARRDRWRHPAGGPHRVGVLDVQPARRRPPGEDGTERRRLRRPGRRDRRERLQRAIALGGRCCSGRRRWVPAGPDPLPAVTDPARGLADPFDLERFVAAQGGYDGVVRELRGGRKTGHWIWFIFPQLAGLGRSDVARSYAIGSLDEARAYLAHPVLGPRLRECAGLVLAIRERTIREAFGELDAMKLRSSMTLFHRAATDDPVFRAVLDRSFDGIADERTDLLLGAGGRGVDRTG